MRRGPLEICSRALLIVVVLVLAACADADGAAGERRVRTGGVPTTLVNVASTTSCPTTIAASSSSVERYLAALAAFDAQAATLDTTAAALSGAWDDPAPGSEGRLEALAALLEDAHGFLSRIEATTAPPGFERHHANVSGTAALMVDSIEGMVRAVNSPSEDTARREALRSLGLRTAIFSSMTAAAQELEVAQPVPPGPRRGC